MKKKTGRPIELTPAMVKAFAKHRRLGLTIQTAAALIGVDQSTVWRWIERGRAEGEGIFSEFCKASDEAKAQAAESLIKRAHERVKAREQGGSDADPLPLLAIVDRQYAPQVRVHVVKELEQAIARLEQEFSHEPEILERALTAISSDASVDRPGIPEALALEAD